MNDTALIAIDWGTTSARAYRMDHTGAVHERRVAPLGIQAVRDGDFATALSTLLGDWRVLPVPRIASGMIGSRQGWREAPYVACPADLDSLAGGLERIPDAALAIVPGVITRDDQGVPDVMRGEETQVVGAIRDRDERALAVLPGTHSKWVGVEQGRILDFTTFMTGEIYDVMLAHSILGRLAEPGAPVRAPGPAFTRGLHRGQGPGSLGHDLFGARTLALTGELPGAEVADWLSGMLIAREVRNARSWAQRRGYDGARVRIIGSDALSVRYAAALEQADVAIERASADAAAHGLWRIAVQSGVVPPPR